MTARRDKLGHTIRVLQDSYPKLFADVPDLSIYTDDVQFVHSGIPEGCLHGLAAYRRLFETLRLTRRTTVAAREQEGAEVGLGDDARSQTSHRPRPRRVGRRRGLGAGLDLA